MPTESHAYATRGQKTVSALVSGRGLKVPVDVSLGTVSVMERVVVSVPSFSLSGAFPMVGTLPEGSGDPPIQVAYPEGHVGLPQAEVPLQFSWNLSLAGRQQWESWGLGQIGGIGIFIGGDNSGASTSWVSIGLTFVSEDRYAYIGGKNRFYVTTCLRCIVTVGSQFDATRRFMWRKYYPEVLMEWVDNNHHYYDFSYSESAGLALTGTPKADYLSSHKLEGKKLTWTARPDGVVADLEGGGAVVDEWGFTADCKHNAQPYVGKRGGSNYATEGSFSFQLSVGAWSYETVLS